VYFKWRKLTLEGHLGKEKNTRIPYHAKNNDKKIKIKYKTNF
jgi:hypothetical protein